MDFKRGRIAALRAFRLFKGIFRSPTAYVTALVEMFRVLSPEPPRRETLSSLVIIVKSIEATSLNTVMESFKLFFEKALSEEDKNIKETLGRLPKSHAALVGGYKFNLQDGNTLNKDDEHVGYIDDEKKTIAVAAPWNYGREFTFLHEIAHKVWEQILDSNLKSKWKKIESKDSEEAFCMAYANYYVKNPVVRFDKQKWKAFIKGLPK